MVATLNAPIPGESLTREPGNAPWEQPSLYNTPEEVLNFYFEKFDDEENIEDLLFFLENGMPISTMVESITTVGVMEGYHTIDVSMVVAPILHVFFKQLADVAGIKYEETDGPNEEEKKEAKKKQRLAIMVGNMLSEDEPEQEDNPVEEMEEGETNPALSGNGLIPRR